MLYCELHLSMENNLTIVPYSNSVIGVLGVETFSRSSQILSKTSLATILLLFYSELYDLSSYIRSAVVSLLEPEHT